MHLKSPIILLLVIVVAGILAFLAIQKVDKYLILKAIHECAIDYRYEYYDEGTSTRITQPLNEMYQKCLEQKDITYNN